MTMTTEQAVRGCSKSEAAASDDLVLRNPFDNPKFFKAYLDYRSRPLNYNDAIEQPALRSCLPTLRGLKVLDGGCGHGEFCRFAGSAGARSVLGVDIAGRMISLARQLTTATNISYIRSSLEEFAHREERFDLIISSLALHYVEDLEQTLTRLRKLMKPDGHFVFSVNHPLYTAAVHVDHLNELGVRTSWTLDHYLAEGPRIHYWLGSKILKYHRTIETYIRIINKAGFRLKWLLEPRALKEHRSQSIELANVDRHPVIVLFACEVSPPS